MGNTYKHTMRIKNTIEINSIPEKVFRWLNDPDRAMKWMTSVAETEIIEKTPGMTGTTFREYIEEDGRSTEMIGIITDYKKNEIIAFHLRGKFNTVDVQFRLRKSGETTILTQTADIHFKSYVRILSVLLRPIFRKKIKRQSQQEFMKLKELCEQES